MAMKTVFLLFGLVLFAMSCVPCSCLAQSEPPPAALGLIARASGGWIGSSVAVEGATLYSGDLLKTEENGSLLVRIGSLSFELQASSSGHVYRAPYGAILELNSGSVVYTTPGGQGNLIVVADDVRVTPVLALPDFGRVSIDGPCSVTVYSQRGQANVQAGSESHLVEEGKAYRVRPENEVAYHQFVSPDASDYHSYHSHESCDPPQAAKGHAPLAAGQSRFLIVTTAVVGTATGIAIWKALESPDRP